MFLKSYLHTVTNQVFLFNTNNYILFQFNNKYLFAQLYGFKLLLIIIWGCPCGVMFKAIDCGIVVREFVL